MNTFSKYNPHESMSDLLLTVLIIFMLMVVTLSLDVAKKITISSKDNTYSGGSLRPTLLIDPVQYDDGKNSFNIYTQQNLFSSDDNMDAIGFHEHEFLGLLPFIDPGLIKHKNTRELLLKIEIYSKMKSYNYVFQTPKGAKGVMDINLLHKVLAKVWENYTESSINTKFDNFQVIKRTKVYYQSLIEKEKQFIVIGHYSFNVAYPDSFSFFNMFATSLTDFVYLGKYDREKRLGVVEKLEGLEAVNYYKKYLEAKDSTSMEKPFNKFPNLAKQIIKLKDNNNYVPPKWVKEKFLNKIGATLKIIDQE